MFNQLRSEDVLVKVIILYNFQHLRTTILREMYNLPCWSEKSRGTKCTICPDINPIKPAETRHAPRGGPKTALWRETPRHKRSSKLALNTYARNVHLNNLNHLLQTPALHKKVHFSPFSSVSAKGRNAFKYFAQRGKQARCTYEARTCASKEKAAEAAKRVNGKG